MYNLFIAKAFINNFQSSQVLFENRGILLWLTLFALIFSIPVYSQSAAFRVKSPNKASLFYVQSDGSVAIDTSAALGSLTVNGNNGIIATGTFGSGTALNLGAGTRMMWYPMKAAFRTGGVDRTQWDDANIGNYSTAMGYGTTASGDYSTAMGYGTTASGDYSTAMGSYTTASGSYSIAMGFSTTAGSGGVSTAMGYGTTASGNYSTAMGYSATASGVYSTAMGHNTTASGTASTAMGDGTTAIGDYSTAMGYGSYSLNRGSFVYSDASNNNSLASSADNQFSVRAAGGYIFYTNAGMTIGAELNPDQSAWSVISDSTKKENFIPVNGEDVLNKISKFNLRSWSYKGQNPKLYRHYGPMAQEFFKAFGHDKIGIIGNDTTINSADFAGINLIAIQALEKRTNELQKELKEKNKGMTALKNKVSAIESSDAKLKEELVNSINVNQNLNARMQQVESAILKLKEVKVAVMEK